ncbi:MAG: TolC family protein [Rickettsiales bacterium]|jgi:TolC family type I secretion outer membrane protein|nr:TolC family protein [Rickettsiales bacterium]
MKKFLFLTLFMLPFAAFAAEEKPAKRFEISRNCMISKDVSADSLGLADVIELAMCNNPTTKEAWINTQAGRMAYNGTLGEYLPHVSASGSYSRRWNEQHLDNAPNVKDSDTTMTGGLSLSWLLYDFGKREAAVERTFQTMNSLNFAYSGTLQQVAYDVISAYYGTLSSVEALSAARANEDATKKSFDLASKKFDLGMASKADKLQTETSYVQAQLDTTRQEQVVKNSRASLAKLMGLPPNMEVRLTPADSSATDEIMSRSVEDIIEAALKKRPDLKAKVAEVNASYAGVRSASATFFPRFEGFASKDWNDQHAKWGDTKLDTSGYAVGVRVSMPIFTGFEDYYSLRNAKYQYAAKKEELHQLEQNVELGVVSAYNDYKTSLKSLSLARKMHESALESEKVATGQYQAGKGDIIRLMEAQSKLLLARKEMIAAQYGVYTYKIALLKAAGELSLKNLGMEQ